MKTICVNECKKQGFNKSIQLVWLQVSLLLLISGNRYVDQSHDCLLFKDNAVIILLFIFYF